MKFYFGRSARRHKIGKAHALAALAKAGEPFAVDGQLHWFSSDDRGVELHIIGKPAVEDPDLVVIYHVFPMNLKETKQ